MLSVIDTLPQIAVALVVLVAALLRSLPGSIRVAAAAALAASALLFVVGPAKAHSESPGSKAWERLEIGEPAPRFALTDQNGRRVRLEDLRGRVVIATFLFTTCTDVCPVLTQILARVDQLLEEPARSRVRFVGITVDPRRDTPERLRAYMSERGLSDVRWTLLTGSMREATQVVADYGVVVRPAPRGDFVHNSVYILIDGEGRNRVEFHGIATPAQEIARAALALAREADRRR